MSASALPPATLRRKVACEGLQDCQQAANHEAKSGGNDGNSKFPNHD